MDNLMKPPSFTPIEKRRLDVLLKRACPKSLNSFPRRYARTFEALLHVRYKILVILATAN